MIIFISNYSVKTRRTWIYPSHNLDNKNCHAVLGPNVNICYTMWGACPDPLHACPSAPLLQRNPGSASKEKRNRRTWLWVIGISREPLNDASLVQLWCFQHLKKLSWRRSCRGRVGADAWTLVWSWHLSPPIWHIHVHSRVTQGREVCSGYQVIPYASSLGGRIKEVDLCKWDESRKSALRE